VPFLDSDVKISRLVASRTATIKRTGCAKASEPETSSELSGTSIIFYCRPFPCREGLVLTLVYCSRLVLSLDAHSLVPQTTPGRRLCTLQGTTTRPQRSSNTPSIPPLFIIVCMQRVHHLSLSQAPLLHPVRHRLAITAFKSPHVWTVVHANPGKVFFSRQLKLLRRFRLGVAASDAAIQPF